MELDQQARLAIVAVGWTACLALMVWYMRRRMLSDRARSRAWAEESAIEVERVAVEDLEKHGWLRRKLHLAGHRRPDAPRRFLLGWAACLLVAGACAWFLESAGLLARAQAIAGSATGAVSSLLAGLVASTPWLLLLGAAILPWAVVDSHRKERLKQVEEDLPTTLEMLATMSESGLAFDLALQKTLATSKGRRPLLEDLRVFDAELRGGVPRVQCFRRFGRRIEHPAITNFVSALVQAEQVGSGFTRVLRAQADDLRNRRREEANAMAQAMTVKLVFPLVICFLPGIFVVALGPAMYKLVDFVAGMAVSQ
jgi:Flp pilus assembly protein TadB